MLWFYVLKIIDKCVICVVYNVTVALNQGNMLLGRAQKKSLRRGRFSCWESNFHSYLPNGQGIGQVVCQLRDGGAYFELGRLTSERQWR